MLLPLDLKAVNFTHEQFAAISADNPDAKMELTSQGELIVMSPTGGESSEKNFNLSGQIWLWNNINKLGKAFDSSCGFILPSNAIRSPDVSWILLSRWEALTSEQKKKFLPLCPDFVVEIRSETDGIKTIRAKMQEYIDNGCRLAWLINPQNKQVEIYRQGIEKEVLDNPRQLSGEDVLLDLIVDLHGIL